MSFHHFFLEEIFMDNFSNDEKNLSLVICYWTLHFLCWVLNSFTFKLRYFFNLRVLIHQDDQRNEGGAKPVEENGGGEERVEEERWGGGGGAKRVEEERGGAKRADEERSGSKERQRELTRDDRGAKS
jgi:hypothetical protein